MKSVGGGRDKIDDFDSEDGKRQWKSMGFQLSPNRLWWCEAESNVMADGAAIVLSASSSSFN